MGFGVFGAPNKFMVSQFLGFAVAKARLFQLWKKIVYTGLELEYHRALQEAKKVEYDLRE